MMCSRFWKLIAVLAIGHAYCWTTANGILRNPFTNRCLHIGYDDIANSDNLNVYSDQCTFSNVQTGESGNPDQWIEIVPISKTSKSPEHLIQKHLPEQLVCVHSFKNSVSVGDCGSSNAVLLFKPIPNSNMDHLGGQVYTIEQPLSGRCLTVLAGSSKLVFVNCSENSLLQHWIACRHIKSCDIEISWSMSKIIFPKDPFNTTSDFEDGNNGRVKDVKQPAKSSMDSPNSPDLTSISEEMSLTDSNASPAKVILNEPLYFIYNVQKFMKIPDKQLETIISKFYSPHEIQEAIDTIEDNFSLHIDPRRRTVNKVTQLINWMKQISMHQMNGNIIFVSENLSRIPSICSKDSIVTPPDQTSPEIATKFRHMRNVIESNLNSVLEKLNIFKTTVLSQFDQFAYNVSNPGHLTQSHQETTSEKSDESILDMIDVRWGGARKRIRPQSGQKGFP